MLPPPYFLVGPLWESSRGRGGPVPSLFWFFFTPSFPSLEEKDKLWAMRLFPLLIFLSLIPVAVQLLGKSAVRWRLSDWGLGSMAHLPWWVCVKGLLSKPVVRRKATLPCTTISAGNLLPLPGCQAWKLGREGVGGDGDTASQVGGVPCPWAPQKPCLPSDVSHLPLFLLCFILRGSTSTVCAF